jgi:hypothetical protein
MNGHMGAIRIFPLVGIYLSIILPIGEVDPDAGGALASFL